MRVAVDWRLSRLSGVGRFLEGLMPEVMRLRGADEFLLIANPDQAALMPAGEPNAQTAFVGAHHYSIGEQLAIPALLRHHRASWYYSPHFLIPAAISCPAVNTVHDVAYFRSASDLRNPAAWAYYRVMFSLAVRKAAYVVTSSNFSKGEIMDVFRVDEGRIIVVPGAVTASFKPPAQSEVERVRAHVGLPERYFLYIGIKRARKNLDRVIEAFASISQDHPQTVLVIAGFPDAKGERHLRRLATHHGVGDKVRFREHIDEGDLPGLYAGALALIYVSLYEGFGLPILEAMACGAPVITANVTAMPETAGGAALLANPTSVPDIAEAMRLVSDDSRERDRLRRSGFTRAAEFSWPRSAEMMSGVFDLMASYPGVTAR